MSGSCGHVVTKCGRWRSSLVRGAILHGSVVFRYDCAMSSDTPGTPERHPASAEASGYSAASVISSHHDTRTAAYEVAELLQDAMPGACDLLMIFGSYHHRAALEDAAASIRSTISPRVMMATTAEAVLGDNEERDGVAGLSAIAMRMPGAQLKTWTTTPEDPMRLKDPAMIAERIGLSDDFRAAIMMADPFTTPVPRLLPVMTGCGGEQPVPIIGGMASGGTQPGLNVLMLDDQVISAGGIGVSIFGDVLIDFVLSQGCRPVGSPMVVTEAQRNLILELGSRPAMEVLQEFGEQLTEKDKHHLRGGLLIGTVINEYKDHFGRGDFLVRNVLGFDKRAGGIAVGDVPRIGQTVQFHVRDAETAGEDLQLLLDAQVMNENKPFAGLLFTCNGRGERLFNEPNHDLNMIHGRFGNLPVAGFFAAGEIGPIGTTSFLHAHTAALALFRARSG